MAANAGFRDFTAGEKLTAAQVDDYLMTQTLMTFANAAARDAAITSPSEGMHAFLKDTNLLTLHNGNAWVTITPVSATVVTEQTTTSTSYTALATAGPAVTVNTDTKALVTVSALYYQTTGGLGSVSFAVSGATTVAASDNYRLISSSTTFGIVSSFTYEITGLTAGANTFTMQYKTSANTLNCGQRRLTVVGVP